MNKYDTVEECWARDDVDEAARIADISSVNTFKECFSNYLGVRELKTVPSARWGLYWLLISIRNLDRPGLVLAPAFNCVVIEEAIRKSGHQLEGYDFLSDNGLVDWECLADRIKSKTHVRPVAIIVTHFFGVPVDWLSIRNLCKELQIFVIEDCAHTLGGSISGHTTGALSDASIYSFNYDKPISLGWGGAIVLQNNALNELWCDDLFKIPSTKQELSYLNRFMNAMQGRRENIGEKTNILTRVLSKAGLRKPTSFKMPGVGIGPLRSQLGIKLLSTFENIRSIRNMNAMKLRVMLPVNRVWNLSENVEPSWLKMKVKMQNSKELRATTSKLQKLGYSAGNFNWPSLIDSSHDFPNAKVTSQLWVDVPIHQNLKNNDLLILANNLTGVVDA